MTAMIVTNQYDAQFTMFARWYQSKVNIQLSPLLLISLLHYTHSIMRLHVVLLHLPPRSKKQIAKLNLPYAKK